MRVVCSPVRKLFETRVRATATIAALAAVVVAGVSVVYGSIPDSAGLIMAATRTAGNCG